MHQTLIVVYVLPVSLWYGIENVKKVKGKILKSEGEELKNHIMPIFLLLSVSVMYLFIGYVMDGTLTIAINLIINNI